MSVSSGRWYKDQLVQYDGQEHQYIELVFNNPRVRTCMNVEEFIQHINNLEDSARALIHELEELGVYLPKATAVADIINDTNGGA